MKKFLLKIKELLKRILGKRERSKKLPKALSKDFRIGEKRLNRIMNIRLLSGVLGVMIFLLGMVTFLTNRSMKSIVSGQLNMELDNTRSSITRDIGEYYRSLELELEAITLKYAKGSFRGVKNISDKSIESIYILDKNYKPMAIYGSEDGLIEMRIRLEKLDFLDPFQVENMRVDEGIASQYAYYKSFNTELGEVFTVAKLNSNFLNERIVNASYTVDIINEEYYVVASTEIEKIDDVQLDSITKNVLGGETGTESYDGTRYSYSHIDIGEVAMFIMVSQKETKYFEILSGYKRKIGIFWILSMGVMVSTTIFLRLAIESHVVKITRIKLDKTSDLKYPYIKREYVDIFDSIDDALEDLEELNTFIESIKVLRNRVEGQNKNYIKEVKLEKQILERLKKDRE